MVRGGIACVLAGAMSNAEAWKKPGSFPSRYVITSSPSLLASSPYFSEKSSVSATVLPAKLAFTACASRDAICIAYDLLTNWKIAQHVCGLDLQSNRQAARGRGSIYVGTQRNREHRFRHLNSKPLLIFHLDALRSIGRNRHDARAEDRSAPSAVGIALAHLQQTRIKRLRADVVINFLGPFAFENHSGDARRVVPNRENRKPARGREARIRNFLRSAGPKD